MLDRLLECTPGERATAVKTFPLSDLIFLDHLIGLPTVPGVLQIEMVAQTLGKCIKLARPSVTVLLGSVRSARFFRRIEPGERCRVVAEVERMREDCAWGRGYVEVDGVRAAQVEILSALVATSEPSPDDPIIQDWKRRQAEAPAKPQTAGSVHGRARSERDDD